MADSDTKNLTSKQEESKGNNPTGKGGFVDHPENRSSGHWDPKYTFSYQMQRFKRMTIAELTAWNENTTAEKRLVVEDLAFKRVFAAQTKLDEFREVADRTEGKPKQFIDMNADVKVTDISNKEVAKGIRDIIEDDGSANNTGGDADNGKPSGEVQVQNDTAENGGNSLPNTEQVQEEGK